MIPCALIPICFGDQHRLTRHLGLDPSHLFAKKYSVSCSPLCTTLTKWKATKKGFGSTVGAPHFGGPCRNKDSHDMHFPKFDTILLLSTKGPPCRHSPPWIFLALELANTWRSRFSNTIYPWQADFAHVYFFPFSSISILVSASLANVTHRSIDLVCSVGSCSLLFISTTSSSAFSSCVEHLCSLPFFVPVFKVINAYHGLASCCTSCSHPLLLSGFGRSDCKTLLAVYFALYRGILITLRLICCSVLSVSPLRIKTRKIVHLSSGSLFCLQRHFTEAIDIVSPVV